MASEEGCYLIYEPGSSGRLLQHYSKTSVPNAIGFWYAGEGKKIQGFKFKQNLGKSEIIRNCAAGMVGRKNYFSGWCMFAKSAKAFNGKICLMAPNDDAPGLEVDVYAYFKTEGGGTAAGTIHKLGEEFLDVSSMAAVSCLAHSSDAYGAGSSTLKNLDEILFLSLGARAGASVKCL